MAAALVTRPARDTDRDGLIALIGSAYAEYPGCVLDVEREELWSDTRFAEGHRFYERRGFTRGAVTRQLFDLSNSTEYHFEKRF